MTPRRSFQTPSDDKIIMKKNLQSFTLAILAICLFTSVSLAQKAKAVAPYLITNISVTPFDEITGNFREPVTPDQWFGNDLSMSLLAKIELTGPAGEFVANRKVAIKVTEGKKVIVSRIGYPGVFSESGKYYVPVWIYGSLCDIVKISASMTGQTKKSSMSRTVNFHCGE